MKSVQSYPGAYTSQQNNISKIRPVEGNVYSYLLRANFTDFINYLEKSMEGKIFLNFLNNLPYSNHFRINYPKTTTFTYEGTRLRYYINYEFILNETLSILFTNTLGNGKTTYACFCVYNNFLKQFTPISGSRTRSSFIASFDNDERIVLSLKDIELTKKTGNSPFTVTEYLQKNNNNDDKYKFSSRGTEV